MAATVHTPQVVSPNGTDLVFVAANADGHYYPNTGYEQIVVKNTDSSAHSVRVYFSGLSFYSKTVTAMSRLVDAGAVVLLGPFAKGWMNFASGANQGQTFFDFDAITGMYATVARVVPSLS